MAKRRSAQERDEATAHEQAEARREALLARLREHEAATRPPEPPPEVSEAAPEAASETPAEDADPPG
jgi:hypothetical protein